MHRVIVACLVVAGFLALHHLFAADNVAELKPGLLARIFDMGGEVTDFPTIPADKKPAVERVDSTVNVDAAGEKWPGTELDDHIYIRWTGVIRIAKAGQYRFFTISDDGSRLFIDGKLVVDNGGLHAAEEKDGTIELKEGDHELKLEFFENEGEAVCKLYWQPPGVADKELVPASVLFHKPAAGK